MVTLDDMANALGFKTPQDVKGFAAYGEVKGINTDETYQVSLNGSTTTVKCARLAGAHVGDVVLVTVLNNGYAVVTGCVGGDKDALEALEKSGATLQHFWHDLAGAHVTEVTQEEYLDDPENAGGNTLITSDGMAIRDGTTALATFEDGGITIGKTEETHTEFNTDGLKFYIDETVNPVSLDVKQSSTGYRWGKLFAKYNNTRQSSVTVDADSHTAYVENGVYTNDPNDNEWASELRVNARGIRQIVQAGSGIYTNAEVTLQPLSADPTNANYYKMEYYTNVPVRVQGHDSEIGYTTEDVATGTLANTTAVTKLSDLVTLSAGTWVVNASIRFTNSTQGTRAAELHNGSTAISASYVAGPANGVVALNLNAVISSDNPIDLDIYARQNSGAAMSINTYWQAVRIA